MDVAVGIQKTIRMRSCWVGGWKGWRFAYAFVALPPISCMNLFHRHFQPVKSASCVSCGWGMLWWFTNWRDSQLLGNGSTDHGTTFFQTFGFRFLRQPPPKRLTTKNVTTSNLGSGILPWCFVKLEYFFVVWFLWHVLAESRQVFVWLALQVYMQSFAQYPTAARSVLSNNAMSTNTGNRWGWCFCNVHGSSKTTSNAFGMNWP